ncbi:WxL domain-containing protein [Enterococcus sp. 669A]|uniref:WxL domain-containing protein n=1 Tax=Candidatus Enterococcus moelleringii TaxID=2815325 RepID=A0ABS3L666_9ENTE|nr:WxL domain-containing protein [Enterococcus sp. 669A]MBO1305107.1 WxL domain-containing protein [Enterococcus sp. 669A]
MKATKWLLAATIGLVGASIPTLAHAASSTDAVVSYTDGGISFNPEGDINNQIPPNLDFGTMAIQTTQQENLIAQTDGANTTGAVSISDNRAIAQGWTVKVNQQTQFANASGAELASAELSISTGAITNNLGNTLGSIGKENVTHKLPIDQDVIVLEAKVNEGLGETSLPLTEFELEIPANTAKTAQQYNTTLNWVMSEAPSETP